MAKALIIVDPQLDFITGSLPVPGSTAAMTALAKYIADHDGKWAMKIVTSDWHPWNHCSFTAIGGNWPRHCVAHSSGASIFPEILEALHETMGKTVILKKALQKDKEEYSIFQNPEAAQAIKELFLEYKITGADICGIAGNICVLATVTDGVEIYGADFFNILQEYSPSLDGGRQLADFCQRMASCAR